MSKIKVIFSPISEVALVETPDKKLYAIKIGSETREEHAPHMFNLQHDQSCYEKEMEDKFPFKKVREELEIDINKLNLLTMLDLIINTELNEKSKNLIILAANSIVQNCHRAFVFARSKMLNLDLSKKAKVLIKSNHFANLSQPLQILFKEIAAKG